MPLQKKQRRIKVLLGALGLCLVFVVCYRRPQPQVVIPLADGSTFALAGTDVGQCLCYGGWLWQRLLCKALKHQLPGYIPYPPIVYPSFYTNGIALLFRRTERDNTPLQTAWNGSGQLFFLDESGTEQLARYH